MVGLARLGGSASPREAGQGSGGVTGGGGGKAARRCAQQMCEGRRELAFVCALAAQNGKMVWHWPAAAASVVVPGLRQPHVRWQRFAVGCRARRHVQHARANQLQPAECEIARGLAELLLRQWLASCQVARRERADRSPPSLPHALTSLSRRLMTIAEAHAEVERQLVQASAARASATRATQQESIW